MIKLERTIEHAASLEDGSRRDYDDKKQLAARIGVSVRTIDNLMKRGLPYIALTSKLRRFPRGTTDAWLRDREVRRG